MTPPNRLGRHAGEGAASFRCAACGEMAAVVRAVPAGRTAGMGPPLGRQVQSGDGVVAGYFGGAAWERPHPPAHQALRENPKGQGPEPRPPPPNDWGLGPLFLP